MANEISYIKDRKRKLHDFKDATARELIEELQIRINGAVGSISEDIAAINQLIEGLTQRDTEIEGEINSVEESITGSVSEALQNIQEISESVTEAQGQINEALEEVQELADGVDAAVAQFTLDDTLSISGQAAEAAAVGAAINAKLDKVMVVNHTNVTEAGNAADARQLNPNISGSLAQIVQGKLDKVMVVNHTNVTEAGNAADARQLNPNVSGSLAQTVQGKLDKTSVVNNGTTTQSGYALDARYGKTLADQVNALNSRTNDYIKVVVGDEIPTTSESANYNTTVTTPSGYKFLANIGVYTSGFVSQASFNPLTKNPRVFFKSGETQTGWCKIVTAFIKN